MPRGDGSGPAGMGPMTGRAAGYCAGYAVPGFANPYIRGGRAFGGRGRGWRNMYYATGVPGWARFGYTPWWASPPVTPAYNPAAFQQQYAPAGGPEQEKVFLKNLADFLKQELEDIKKRLAELDKADEE